MPAAIIIIGALVLLGVLWWLLDRHERRRAASGLPRHSGLRVLVAACGLLTMLFAGGCAVLFLANKDGVYVTWQAVALFAGPPFLAGLLAGWLSLRRKAG
jgi:hypothetical protein